MILPRYELESDDELLFFEFTNVGIKGEIQKAVQYTETSLKGLYNLGFGDKISETNAIDDLVVSNNGDSQKVLATVASTVYAFTHRYPNAWVYVKGSTKSRTRLYRHGADEVSGRDFAGFRVVWTTGR